MVKKTVISRWFTDKRISLKRTGDLLDVASETVIYRRSAGEKISPKEISSWDE